MKITFCGAARSVTGSCYLVENAGCRFLVDCGMFQGSDEDNFGRDSFPFDPRTIDFVLVTHAHIDHTGRIPLLVKRGFSGRIYSTAATKKLSEIMLLDSAHIQEMEAEWGYKKQKRGSSNGYRALYDVIDAQKSIKKFVSVPYGKLKKINEGVSFRFQDAGHLLGSCHIEVWLKEGGIEKKVVFSGDIGNTNQPLIKDPTFIRDADFVLAESTYGEKLHENSGVRVSMHERAERLAAIIDETFRKKGNLIIPAFAVGRTQEMLYMLHVIYREKLLPYKVPVFIDSPMGIKACDVFAASVAECYDDESKRLMRKGENILHFPTLLVAETQEESKNINEFPDSCVIISSSGMCNAGRIKHHLKYNLWRENSTILFTGYQAGGTLGRMIVDGAHSVKIFGEVIDVKATVLTMKSLSGHADQSGIIRWLSYFDKKRLQQVFIVHGEEKSAEFFAGFVNKELGLNAYAPAFNESFDLLSGGILTTEYRKPEESEEKIRLGCALEVLQKQMSAIAEIKRVFADNALSQNPNEKKKMNKLVNRTLYFASDIEELVNKWKYMVGKNDKDNLE